MLALGSGPPAASAQESKSAPLVKTFVEAAGSEMRYVAAKVPSGDDEFVAALHIPGVQLLVIAARYQHPMFLNEMLGKRDYQGVYADLNSSSYTIVETRLFFEDLRADGLAPRRESEDMAFDSYEAAGRRVLFDGDWRKQKLSDKEYADAFAAADQKYAQLMSLLTEQLKKAR